MTTTLSTSHTARTTADEVEPSRLFLVLGLVFLVVGFAVDLMQFRTVVGLVNTSMSDLATWTIAVGAGAVAIYTMVEAGRQEAERRRSTRGRHGRAIVRRLVGVWLFLGLAATYIRLTVDPGVATATGGFGEAAAGTAEAVWHLGPLTLYPAEIPMALLMLALYLAVGIGAYIFGLRSFRPELTALRRARRTEGQRQEKLQRMVNARDKQAGTVLHLRQRIGETDRDRQGLHARATLEAAVQAHEAAAAHESALAVEAAQLQHELYAIEAELTMLDASVQGSKEVATSMAAVAQQHARSRLHQHLGDPARTVKDGDVLTLPTTARSES